MLSNLSRLGQTICEVNGELIHEENLDTEYLDSEVSSYPEVHVTLDSLLRSTLLVNESAQSAFIEHSETLMQKVRAAWYGHGLIGALTEISDTDSTDEVHPYVKRMCQYLLVTLRWISGMQITPFPHLKLPNEELISSFSENSDWSGSPIRYLAWHSRANKFALALRDDTIRIYYSDNALVPMLKHKLQRNITVVTWKPLSASTLAVGTQTAILVWNIDPSSLSSRPSASAVQLLFYSGHSPITSLAWSPHGLDHLFAASALNSALVVWDVSIKEHQVIRHMAASGGVSRLSFSPDGSKVMASTPTSSFRVFETGTWTNERWSKLAGRVQASCWNPDGTFLLFALYGDVRVYSITFPDSRSFDMPVVDGSKHASVVLDLTPELDEDENDPVERCKNSIHSMILDGTGERLAVMFSRDDPRHALISLYSVSADPVLSVSQIGCIRGEARAHPTFISFKPNFGKGALLTACYSNGVIRYIPMYFQATQTNTKNIISNLDGSTFQSNRTMLDTNQTIWSAAY